MVLGKRCVYRKCGRYRVQYPELIFFQFTLDPLLRDVWIQNCGIEEGTNLSDAYVCETHFKNALTSDKVLKKTARPIPFSEKDSEAKDPISEFLAHSCKYCGSIFSTELTSTQHLFYCRSHDRYNEPFIDPNAKTKKSKIKCVVTRCNETFSSSRLFPLPSEPNRRKVWLQDVPVPIKYSPLINVFYVCEKHFSESDIITDVDGVRLKEDAVPSGFNFPTGQDAGVQPCCIPTCTSNHSPSKTRPITTFPFPPDFQSLAREWQNILFKNFRVFIPNGAICRKHFKDDVVYISGRQSFLAHGAVPTIFSKSVDNPLKLSFAADYDDVVKKIYKKPNEAIIDITSDSEDDSKKAVEENKKGTEKNELVCCVPTCASTAVGARGFHIFPLPCETYVEVIYAQPPSRCATSGVIMDLFDLWKSRASVDDVTPTTVICTNHFTSSDYVQADQTFKLYKYALPSRRLAAEFPPCMILPKEKDKIRFVTKPREETSDKNLPCSVPDCFSHVSRKDGIRRKMFSLPNHIIRARKWAKIFGHEDWLHHGLQWALDNIKICSAHFKSCMFTDEMDLKIGALPFPPDPLGVNALGYDPKPISKRTRQHCLPDPFPPYAVPVTSKSIMNNLIIIPSSMIQMQETAPRGRPKKNITLQERMERKREAERLRRAKIKANPDLHQKYKESEKMRYVVKKQNMVIKTIDQLSANEQIARRKEVRERVKLCRLRKKLAQQYLYLTPPWIKSEATEQTSQKKKLPNILSKTSKNDESSSHDSIYLLNSDPLALGTMEIEKPDETLQPSSFYVKCTVASCNNYFDDSRGEYLGQSYFTFPEDPFYRKAWIKALNKPYQWSPSKRARICFRHFHSMDVHKGKLSPTAIPTLCLGSNLENSTEVSDSADISSIAVTNPFETKNDVVKRSGRKTVEKPREDYYNVESDSDKKTKKRGPPRKRQRTLPFGSRRKKIPIEEPSEDKMGNHFLSEGQEFEDDTDFSEEIDLPEEPEIKLGEPSNCFIIKEETEELDIESEALRSDSIEPQSDLKIVQIKQEFEEVVELSDTEVQESILSQSLMCDQSPAISEVDDFIEFCMLLKDDFLKLNATDKFDFITSMKKKMSDLLKKNYPKPYE